MKTSEVVMCSLGAFVNAVAITALVFSVHYGCAAVKDRVRAGLGAESVAEARVAAQPAPTPTVAPGQVWEQRIHAGSPWDEKVVRWTVVAVSNGWVRFRWDNGVLGSLPQAAFLQDGKLVEVKN